MNFWAGIYEEAAIILRRLYGEEASLSLEARGTERFAEMMASSGNLDQAEGKDGLLQGRFLFLSSDFFPLPFFFFWIFVFMFVCCP